MTWIISAEPRNPSPNRYYLASQDRHNPRRQMLVLLWQPFRIRGGFDLERVQRARQHPVISHGRGEFSHALVSEPILGGRKCVVRYAACSGTSRGHTGLLATRLPQVPLRVHGWRPRLSLPL